MKAHLRITVRTLLVAGRSQREIERMTGVDRKTIRRYSQEIAAAANSPTLATGSGGRGSEVFAVETPPPRPPAQHPKLARSACEEHREWIESQVALGRNAQSIYQDLVDRMGFAHRYNSVKRFVRTLRKNEPERFDILDGRAGEEAQVDFGLGAPTRYRTGRYRRPFLFRDDAEVFQQSLSQGRVESGPGELGTAARRGFPSLWRFGRLCRARQFEARRDPSPTSTSRS